MERVERALNGKLTDDELEDALNEPGFLQEYSRSCLDELVIQKAFELVPATSRSSRKIKKKKSYKSFFVIAAAAALIISFLFIRQQMFPVIGHSLSNIELVRNGQSLKLVTSSEIKQGDVIETGRIRLKDGTSLNIAPGSSLQLDFDKGFKLLLHHGELTAKVTPQKNPMKIQSGKNTATVLGTEFNLIRVQDQSLLTVSEGKVKWSRAEEGVLVSGGEQSLSIEGIPLTLDNTGFSAYRSFQLKNNKFLKPLVHYTFSPLKQLKSFDGAEYDKLGRWNKNNMSFAGKIDNRFEAPWFDGLNTSEFTACVWFKPQQVGGHRQGILSQRTVILREPRGGGRGWSFLLSSSGKLEFWYGSKQLYWQLMASQQLKKNKWYMATATVKKLDDEVSEIIFYLNGREIGRQKDVYTPPKVQDNRLHVGGMSSQTQLKQQMKKDHMEFEGQIDEFFILSEILTVEEIKNLYLKGLKD
jgi:hypothetical protein